MRYLFTGYFFLLSLYSFSQNLLTNGRFEEENICTEYSVNCAPEGWITNKDGFSTYYKDSASACNGERFLAIEAGHITKLFQRTFSRTQLLCGLRKDHTYRLELYIRSPHDILDSIGVIFTSFDFLFGKKRLQNLTPSLFLKPASGYFRKDSNWQKVSVDYSAAGDEAFLSIANFSRRDIKGPAGSLRDGHYFVFADDISLMPLDPHEYLCREATVNKENIYAQDERHEFMRQKVRLSNDNPPQVVMPATVMLKIDTLVLPDVLFASGKAVLHKNSFTVLDDFYKNLSGRKIDSIVVEGHTDNTGTAVANAKLSTDRANTVAAAIRKRMVSPQLMIITRGRAGKKPLADNKTAAGKQKNRRVELFVYATE